LNLVHVMEHPGRGGTSANPSLDMSDFNGLALTHDGLFFCTDLMQGNCGAGSLIPLSPSSSSSSHVVDLQPWSFETSDCLWASHENDQSFHSPLLHEAAEPPTRDETDNLSCFTQDHLYSSHPFEGLEIPCEANLYGGSSPEGIRVDTKEPNCGYSSDEIDDLKDGDEKGSQDGRSPQPPKTLTSERRRRGRLNEALYTLRSLVPKITKLDKASIVGDTISYVQELQKEVKDIRDEIESLRSNLNRQNDSTPLDRDRADMQSQKEENGNSPTPPKEAPTSPTLDVNVNKVDDRTFHIRIYCKKRPGVLVRLMVALESIQLEFHNANVTYFDGYIIKTATVKIKKPCGLMEANALRGAILEAAFKNGFRTT